MGFKAEGLLLHPFGLWVEQEEYFPSDSVDEPVDAANELDVVLFLVGDGDVLGGDTPVLLHHAGAESALHHRFGWVGEHFASGCGLASLEGKVLTACEGEQYI